MVDARDVFAIADLCPGGGDRYDGRIRIRRTRASFKVYGDCPVCGSEQPLGIEGDRNVYFYRLPPHTHTGLSVELSDGPVTPNTRVEELTNVRADPIPES